MHGWWCSDIDWGDECGNVGKTIEVRRSEAEGDKGKSDSPAQLRRLFYISTEDMNRAQVGLPPMPKPVPPPPPPSKERTQEILDDDRVKVRDTLLGAVPARTSHPDVAPLFILIISDGANFDRGFDAVLCMLNITPRQARQLRTAFQCSVVSY